MKRNLLFAAMTLIAALWSTKAYAQEDVTATYVKNADLSADPTSADNGWTCSWRENYQQATDDVHVNVVEFYSGWGGLLQTTFSLSQTLTLPAGDYRIAVNAFYRHGEFGDGSNNGNAYIFAGEKKQNVLPLSSLSSYTAGGIGGSADLQRASNAFYTGAFSNAFDFTMEEDGTIEVGFAGEFTVQRSWVILGPVKLYKYSIEDYLNDYRSKVAEAEALYDDPMSGTALDELMSNVVDESTLHTSAEVAEAIANLNTAILAAQQSAALYKKLDEAITAAETIETEAVANGATDITYIASVRTDYDNGDIEDDEVDLVIEILNSEVVDMAKTQTAAGSDMTIVADYLPWTCEQGNGPNPYAGTATETYLAGDAGYAPGKVMYKRIEGLQPGTYEVLFYATANHARENSAFGADIAQAYANDQVLDIDVIDQDACTITDYERSFTCEVGEDGVLEFGLQNIAQGGQWYVAQVISLTLVELAQEVKPTSVDITISDAIPFEEQYLATYCSPYDLDFTDVEGITAYTAVKAYEEGYAGQTITGLNLSPIAQVPAGMPVLLKADAAQTYTVPVPEETLPAVDVVNELAVADADLDLFDAVTTSEYGEFVSGPAVLDFQNVMTGIDYETFDYIYEDVAGFFPCAKPAAAETVVLEAGTVYLPITAADAYEAMTNPYIKLTFTDKPIEVVEVENIAGLYALNGENIEVALTLTDAQITKIAGDESYNFTIIEDASGAALFQDLGVYGIVNEGEVLNGTLNLKANVGEVFGIKVQQFTASERTLESDLMTTTGTAEPTAVTDENIDDWAASFNWRYVSMENVPFTLEESGYGDVPTVTFYDIPFSVQDLFGEGIELPTEACNVNLSGFFAEYQGSYIFVPATIEVVEEPITELTYEYEGAMDANYEGASVGVEIDKILDAIGATEGGYTVYTEIEGERITPIRGDSDGWRNADGVFTGWSADGSSGCAYFVQDDGTDIVVGRHPALIGTEGDYTAKLVYVNNETLAELPVYIHLTYPGAEVIDYTFNDLNVLAEDKVDIQVDLATYYQGKRADVDVAAIFEALGVESLDELDIFAVQSDGTLDANYKLGATDGWRDAQGDWKGHGAEAYFYVKADFSAASTQIYEAGTIPETVNTNVDPTAPAIYTAKYAFVVKGSETHDAFVLSVVLNYGDTTGIESLIADKSGEQTIYDLSGRRVRTITKGGMYIVNGKKVFVK